MNRTAVLASSLLLLLLATASMASPSTESSAPAENSTQSTSGRSGRSDYSPPIYSPPDTYPSKKSGAFHPKPDAAPGDGNSRFQPRIDTRVSKDDDSTSAETESLYSPNSYEEYEPMGHYYSPSAPGPRFYEPEPNWNAWKDQMDSSATSPVPDNKGFQQGQQDFGEYFFPSDGWKGDMAFTPDQIPPPMMMMMMNKMQSKSKFGGLLSKLKRDPMVLLVVAILPLSMILASVLPSLINMMMNGGLPIVTTTATGNNNARSFENAEFLRPVFQTITMFGGRSFDNPDCMQKIFCQVTKGSSENGTESRSFQKTLYAASRLIDSHWLESFGVKTLFDSMADGNCEKIPCSAHSSKSRSEDSKTKS